MRLRAYFALNVADGVDVAEWLFNILAHFIEFEAGDGEQEDGHRPDDDGFDAQPALLTIGGISAGIMVDSQLMLNFRDQMRAAGARCGQRIGLGSPFFRNFRHGLSPKFQFAATGIRIGCRNLANNRKISARLCRLT